MKIKLSTRLVLIGKKKVLKIPFDRRGYLQGKNEKKVWDKYNAFCNLAPLVWSRFGIVVQIRCEPLDVFDYSYVKKIKKIVSNFDIDNCDLYKLQNWGMYKGKQVLLDYGIDERISKMY